MARDPLLLLGRLKLKGSLRRQLRKLRTPKGAILTLLGALLLVAWIAHLAFVFGRGGPDPKPETLPQRVGVAGLVLATLALSGSLSHRGLFVPKEEIERLFSAPLSRRQIVRYRLRTSASKSLLGGAVVGLLAMRHVPNPWFGFLGAALAMQTVPVLQQFLAILLGGLEQGIGRRLAWVGRVLGPLALLAVLGLTVVAAGGGEALSFLRPIVESFERRDTDPLEHPWIVLLSRPFLPWANLIGAPDLGSFLLWGVVCVAILLAGIEATARLPMDFRELSLETSASIAARIRRAGRGGGVAARGVRKGSGGRRVPWLFGRTPAGAVAWRKTASILRKARGTLLVSLLVLVFVGFLSHASADVPPWAGSALIGGVGTIYLCAGLRFDFREELDRMEVIRAWPLGPTRLFVATLVPEVCLVSALVGGATLVRGWEAGGLHPGSVAIALGVPLVVTTWVALDNAVFLLAPVRMVPGQEGALQNAGRGILLLLLRTLVLGALSLVAGVGFLGGRFLGEAAGLEGPAALGVGVAVVYAVVVVLDVLLVLAGGRVLKRFDVSRDR